MSTRKTMKPLKTLNLLDRFLFAEAMEDPENVRVMLEIILGRAVELAGAPQTEKEQRRDTLNRYVKLDVWAQDTEGTVYDTEVQKKNTHNLPKRSRYYQAMIDSGLLQTGELDFNTLNQVYIIVITPFDLFGEGKYCYTFRMRSDENTNVALDDGAVRIFLNTKGQNPQDVRPELIELLRYMEHTNEETVRACSSEHIKEMHRRIEHIKSNKEVNLKYMQAWEERAIDIKEGEMRGEKRGEIRGKSQVLLDFLSELGEVPQGLKKRIRSERNLQRLSEWIKLAARADSMEEFCQKAGINL